MFAPSCLAGSLRLLNPPLLVVRRQMPTKTLDSLIAVMSARLIIFLLAPLPTIVGSVALAHWAHQDPNRCATRNEVRQRDTSIGRWQPEIRPYWATADLRTRCDSAAENLRGVLTDSCNVMVDSPFIVAGNLPKYELRQWHASMLVPAMTSMQRDFFRATPENPITVLLFSDEVTYRAHAARRYGDRNVSVYGYYQPTRRTLVINLSAGSGTLIHELTHALFDCDYPDVPLWFNEGLASLHEQCDMTNGEQGPEIRPLHNWRLKILQDAIVEGRLLPTSQLMNVSRFRGQHEALLYAHSRYFCFYLHEHGLLTEYYRRLRRHKSEPDASQTVARRLFSDHSWAEIEQGFRAWVMRQSVPPVEDPVTDAARRAVDVAVPVGDPLASSSVGTIGPKRTD